MVAPAAPRTVSYDVYLRELERRKQAERDRDYWKNEFYLQRDIRRAPVLQPIGKAILEECRHVEKWGTVKAPDGSTRANFTTIAKHLHSSPGTVAKHAERLAKLDLIEIHEHLGPKDECDRKYIHVKEEHLAAIDQLQDPDDVVPQQGGDRFYRCIRTGIKPKSNLRNNVYTQPPLCPPRNRKIPKSKLLLPLLHLMPAVIL